MVGGKPHAVDEKLAAVKWAQVHRRWIAELDHPEKFIIDRVYDGDGVRKLIGCIESIAMGSIDIWGTC